MKIVIEGVEIEYREKTWDIHIVEEIIRDDIYKIKNMSLQDKRKWEWKLLKCRSNF